MKEDAYDSGYAEQLSIQHERRNGASPEEIQQELDDAYALVPEEHRSSWMEGYWAAEDGV